MCGVWATIARGLKQLTGNVLCMIILFTDFGVYDPYVGQMHAVLAQRAPGIQVIDLCHHVPNFDIKAGAYLLAALVQELPHDAICVGVVDPGVGGRRDAIMVRADGRWFVGPDNGLFAIVMRRPRDVTSYRIDWRPAALSNSFHGRDLFAPVAAMLAQGTLPASTSEHLPMDTKHWPDDWDAVIYIDHYGNAITGLRASNIDIGTVLELGDTPVHYARTFSEVPPGQPFWYGNSFGLLEIAMNQDHAAQKLEISHGDRVRIRSAG